MNKLRHFKIFPNKYVNYSLILILGTFIGWLVFHPSPTTEEKHDHSSEAARGTIWTCAMHPQIRMEQPGKCPICGMELIPLAQSSSTSIDPSAIHLSKEAAQLANVLTSVVTKQKPVKEVRLYGKVQADERLFQSQTSHVPGRIERLSVNYTGETVVKGQVLAEIYSPELITAQQELLETVKTKQLQPELYEASKEKLHQWKLTDDQIAKIESSGVVQNNFEVVSNTAGTVTARRVNTGDHVSQGTVLFDIADLSKVWIMFDAYESDLQFLHTGEKLSFTLQALPGIDFSGNIIFIDPIIDPVTRVAKVRVETGNQSGKLKPEMFATGIVSTTLKEYRDNMVIPKTAVLWTGKRSVVYVKQQGTDEPFFKLREIGLGPMLGESYVVTDGLTEGEEIVTSGTFSVDAAAQLEGKPSMMNQGSGKTSEMTGRMEGNLSFIMQLNTVYDKYVVLKNAFILSDVSKVIQDAVELQNALSEVNMKLLSGDAHIQWMKTSVILDKDARLIASSENLEEQRLSFSSLTDNFYKTIQSFGLKGRTVYYQFCPMAKNGKGAYWLSETKDILNPYYGESMLTCGETIETLNF
jgi:Cu(I)/Ag(I) efflux system membrane fusion protein